MAKKAELLAEAKKLKLDVTEKNTIKQIEAAIEAAGGSKTQDEKSKKPNEEPTEDKKPNEPEAQVAKAGKRSAKAIKEEAEKKLKEERRADNSAAVKASSQSKKPARSRLERAGKKYRELAKNIDRKKSYNLADALALAVKTSPTKFDATVELHINLNVDPKQAEQNIRGSLTLPAGTGKTIRVATFTEGPETAEAKKAGADLSGADEIQAMLDKQQIDFDILISTPQLMARLSKYARFLGPRGLMPNPKSGTVTANVAKAVTEAKAGRVEYRTDSFGIVHLGIGKASFKPDDLVKNAEAVLSSLRSSRPSGIKGGFIKSLFVSTTMGPSIKIEQP